MPKHGKRWSCRCGKHRGDVPTCTKCGASKPGAPDSPVLSSITFIPDPAPPSCAPPPTFVAPVAVPAERTAGQSEPVDSDGAPVMYDERCDEEGNVIVPPEGYHAEEYPDGELKPQSRCPYPGCDDPFHGTGVKPTEQQERERYYDFVRKLYPTGIPADQREGEAYQRLLWSLDPDNAFLRKLDMYKPNK